jgi:tight adherence protein B
VVTTFAPYLIVVGIAGAIGYFGYRSWNDIIQAITPFTEPYQILLERGGIKMEAADLAFRILAIAIFAWGAGVLILRPNGWIALACLPLAFLLTFWGTGFWVRSRIGSRLKLFNDQLEIALRLMTSGLRAGLGLRQAMIVVVSEMPDPIRVEFNKVLNQTSIGISIYDALDTFNERMPSAEMLMLTRAIRIQSKTGGNLSKMLETLAETIKQRRRIDRKVAAMTSEARSSSYVMSGLPIGLLIFIAAFQPEMRGDLFGTWFGRAMVIAALSFIGLGQYVMNAMAKIDV